MIMWIHILSWRIFKRDNNSWVLISFVIAIFGQLADAQALQLADCDKIKASFIYWIDVGLQ